MRQPADPGSGAPGGRWLGARIRRHLGELVRLAAPVVVARTGILTMVLVDTIMVGRYATEDLAHLALGNTIAVTLLVVVIGLLTGTVACTAQAFGREDWQDCGAVWQRAVPYALALGAGAAVICQFGAPILRLFGQPPALAGDGAAVLAIIGLGLPFALAFTASSFFLEGVKQPLAGMVVILAANVANFGLNWVLIYGNLGAPALGAEGSAWATTLVRMMMATGLVGYVLLAPRLAVFGVRRWRGWHWRRWAAQRRIGYAAAVSYGLESTAFAALGLMAGIIGATALAAFAIMMNVVAIAFMMGLGIAVATAVRVGIAFGRADWSDLAVAGWTGLGLAVLTMAATGTAVMALPETLSGIYTPDPVLAAAVVPLLVMAGLIVLFDSGQVVMSLASRGRSDNLWPTALHAVSYYGVMLPCGWILAIERGGGAIGLAQAVLIGSAIAAALQTGRFAWRVRADRRAADRATDQAARDVVRRCKTW